MDLKLSFLLSFMLLSLSIVANAQPTSFPDWLAGNPDTEMKTERCSVYRWFFARADDQTDGLASQNSLARNRVINIANKLVDHHQSARQKKYEGRVKYLVFGEKDPYHFTFHITSSRLNHLLNHSCN